MVKKKYDNEFKVMIVELLQSGISAQQISDQYVLNVWRREYISKCSCKDTSFFFEKLPEEQLLNYYNRSCR